MTQAASPWLTGVDFYITDPVTQNIDNAKHREAQINAMTQGMAVGGAPGFSLDKDQAVKMVTDAMAIRIELEKLQNKAEFLEKMTAPAKDPASSSFNESATWQGGTPGAFAYGSGHLRLEVMYLSELIKRLNKALGRTSDTDDDLGTVVTGTAKTTGGLIG